MGAAAIEPASRALGHLGDAANQLLSDHDQAATALALACLEAASDLADTGLAPAPVPSLPAHIAIRRAASLLQLDPRAELQLIGNALLNALTRGA
ncbi:MAG: hypothetical protein IT193_08665 [Propionibacteriaceae bacterium]|nr:hypothetical protein [Propionibacteriaceae bacterium]